MNRNSEIIIIFTIITAILFQSPSVSDARTIALVYDDSGSMKGKNKWVYANYASQSLAALLRQDEDTLSAVLMSSPGRVNRMGTGEKTLNRIRNQWGAKGETPYEAVETAMDDELLKKSAKQTGAFDKQKQDWLIVMTDGQFFKSLNEAEKNKLKDDIKNRYIDRSRGLIRIVFLLIGEDADRMVPRLWEEVAPEQVDIVTAANEQDIVRKMSEIAAMITGRDIGDTDIVKKDNLILLTSLFPVRRITLFEQGISGSPAAVDGIEFPGTYSKKDIIIESLNIKSPKDNLAGKVTHCRHKMIMPAGDYVIRFKEDIEKKAVQVLLETAVDFKVILRDTKGAVKAPDKNGVFKLCQSQDMLADIQFLKAETDDPLFLDSANTKDLNLTVSLNTTEKKHLTFDKNTGKFFPMPFAVRQGIQTLSAETKSPGYFHLKSNIITIEGEDCIIDKKIGINCNHVEIPYTYSKEPVTVSQKIDLTVDDTGGKQQKSQHDYKLSAEGIPPGIFIRIDGNTELLNHSHSEIKRISLKQGEILPVEILRNREYKEDKLSEIKLKIFSDDTAVRWEKDQAVFTLKPVPRNITLEPANNQWRASIPDLKQAHPFDLLLKADGNPISGEEMESWSIQYKTSWRIELDVIPDNSRSLFHLQPRPYKCSTCWTGGGNIQAEMTAKGSFPSEKCINIINLNIEDAPFWKRCKNLILTIFFILLFLWWLIGIIRKPRFAKGSVITYQRKQSHIESRPITESLPESWFSRWLIPYLPEKKSIRKITFTPGNTSGSVTVTKDQERDNVIIDGSPQDRPWRHDLKLGRNSTLEEEFGNQIERYTYK